MIGVRAGVLAMVALLAGATLTTAAGFVPTAARIPESPPAAGYTDVTLTATLDVTSGETVQNTRFHWAGPSDVPMIRLAGASFAHLDHLAFEVLGGRHATAAVELVSSPGGGPLGDDLVDLRIGSPGERAGLDYGIRWTGQLNGDSNTFTNIAVFGADTAGVSVNNPQATGNSLRSLYVFDSPIGLQTVAGGTITCDNCGFIGSTDVDLELTGGAGLIVTGVYSEGSHSFARVGAGPGAGGLSVAGGYWQHGPKASGATITGVRMCCYRSWVRLTDFMVTPLTLAPAGTVVGVPAGKLFLTDVAGIAG